MEDILVSAPGKLIWHGEHAVVYDKKALAASLNLRTYLHLQAKSMDVVEVNFPDITRRHSWSPDKLMKAFKFPLCPAIDPQPASDDLLQNLANFAGISTKIADTKDLAVLAFLYLYGSIATLNGHVPGLVMNLASHLPTGAGLGSSAAFSTCLAMSLLVLKGLIPRKEHSSLSAAQLKLINNWAFMAEKIIHGRPSGIDNSISTYGGALIFQSGDITHLDRVPEVSVLLVNTKVPRSTKKLVAGVKEKYDMYPDIMESVLDCVEAITSRCLDILTHMVGQPNDQEIKQLEELISMNQHQLRVMGVGHPALDTICNFCAEHGFAAKLTGAGGGGCAFVLLTKDKQQAIPRLAKAADQYGYTCWETTIGGPGVTIHSNHQTNLTLKLPVALVNLFAGRKS